MSIRIAINGFGRIGRNALRVALERSDIDVVAINDLTPARVLAHLLKYDSAYGIYPKEVRIEEDGSVVGIEGTVETKDHLSGSAPTENFLIVNGRRIRVISEKDPSKVPWKGLGIDVVLECTGRFTENGSAAVHLESGAKRVIVSAPTKGGGIPTFLLGVNHDKYQGERVVSNASCTTNCIAPISAVMESRFGVIKAVMTTIHAVTAEQNLVDGIPPQLHHDLRRARSALTNIVPTTTGAAISTIEVIKELQGVFDGLAFRVPLLVGSISDLTFLLKRRVTVSEVNQAFIDVCDNPFFKGIIGVTREPLVSSDIISSSYSAVVDLTLTKVIDGDLVKIVAWYDNEWGYSNRLVELALLVGSSL